eukprot:gnl/TRDRNA2_/TRDRNA2_189211_c0_seq1.p1 gnl/TRDRNA2_/TRDRNA2_189211_c0~~gnl/TRDRNA2_/TRDRNA2_189211_c0_seq1.p1  ORF type:complete len:232 (-),score=48.65 gnl/TRDRNA2_/TRDRNA2_189211_c0_seq1:38-733(-)
MAVCFDPRALLGVDEAKATDILCSLPCDGGIVKAEDLEAKSFSDCRYLNAKAAGLSVRLKPASAIGLVDVVFLYNEGVCGFKAYAAGPLPFSLEWSHTSGDVVRRLGEPSDKWGGGRLQVGIGYETKGLDVHFKGCSWDDAKNELTFLSVYTGLDEAYDLCKICAKQARFHCSRCRQVRYCSSSCQQAHWSQHKVVCEARGQQKQLDAGTTTSTPEDKKAAAPEISLSAMD